EHGWDVHIASMTPGDCGSVEHGPVEISRLRRSEGAAAAQLIGGHYHCLEERDLLICYGEATLEKVTRLLRQVRPSIVFRHSPIDYMVDHEQTSVIVRAAALPRRFRISWPTARSVCRWTIFRTCTTAIRSRAKIRWATTCRRGSASTLAVSST